MTPLQRLHAQVGRAAREGLAVQADLAETVDRPACPLERGHQTPPVAAALGWVWVLAAEAVFE